MEESGRIVIGNITMDGQVIKESLKEAYYWMKYEHEKQVVTLGADHGMGWKVLLEINGISHENAMKLANELGLEEKGKMFWEKGIPSAGSAEAQMYA